MAPARGGVKRDGGFRPPCRAGPHRPCPLAGAPAIVGSYFPPRARPAKADSGDGLEPKRGPVSPLRRYLTAKACSAPFTSRAAGRPPARAAVAAAHAPGGGTMEIHGRAPPGRSSKRPAHDTNAARRSPVPTDAGVTPFSLLTDVGAMAARTSDSAVRCRRSPARRARGAAAGGRRTRCARLVVRTHQRAGTSRSAGSPRTAARSWALGIPAFWSPRRTVV